jgi:hypothetical protein
MRVRAAVQIACAYSRELGRAGVNCNPNCNLGCSAPSATAAVYDHGHKAGDASIDRGAGPFVWRVRRHGDQLDR